MCIHTDCLAFYFLKKECDAIDPTENRPSLPPQRKSQSRANVNVEDIENLISSIVTVPIDDGVKFQLKSISEIMCHIFRQKPAVGTGISDQFLFIEVLRVVQGLLCRVAKHTVGFSL